MALPAALSDLPGDLLPSGLAGAGGRERAVAEVVFEQRRCENLAYCRTMTAVYALHRVMYADDEAEFLAGPGDFAEAVEARRRLTAAGVAVEAQVSTLLRLGPAAARLAIETAIGFVERLPGVFALIGENVISSKAGEAALHRSRALDGVQVRRFDELLVERLSVEYEVLSLPALREAVDLIVERIDAEAAERRRRAAVEDRRVSFRPEQDGMAAVFALLPAEDVLEVQARVEFIAGTVCGGDPRSVSQRRADGWVQLVRGFGTLGCRCDVPDCSFREARFHGEPDADGVVTRFVTLFTVVLNERDVVARGEASPDVSSPGSGSGAHGDPFTEPEPDPASERNAAAESEPRSWFVPAPDSESEPEMAGGPVPAPTTADGGEQRGFGYLVGHGPITLEHALELAARADARIRPFGRRIDEHQSSTTADDDHASAAFLDDDGMRGTLDFAAVWADIVVRLEGHSGPGDGGAFDGGPPDGGPPVGPNGPGGDPDPPDGGSPRGGSSGGDRPDPSGVIVTAQGSGGYRPSADLRRYLRLVFPRCVFPYCTCPASRAQLDHRREFDHRDPAFGGATTAEELQPLCVAHHQLKTAGVWIDARLPDGRILWTSPDGRRYIVDPSGTVLALFPDLKRVRWIVPDTAASSTGQRSPAQPGGPTRLQREHARRQLLRQRNIAAMQADLDRSNAPVSTVEEHLAAALDAPPPTRPAPSFDGPPPF